MDAQLEMEKRLMTKEESVPIIMMVFLEKYLILIGILMKTVVIILE